LARLLYTRGERAQALEVLAPVQGSFAAEGLRARLALEDDHPELAEAFAALDSGQQQRGLELLLNALQSADGARDDVRRVIVGVLDELGVDDPLARETRRKLAAALY
jgi:putative thioredoxin